MDDYFTLRGLLDLHRSTYDTVGSRDKLCSACFEKYREGHVTDMENCWDDLVDTTIKKCNDNSMCRPYLMLIVRDCTTDPLFTYRCDLRSKEFDNVESLVLFFIQRDAKHIKRKVMELNGLLKYKNARKSLDAFITMVHNKSLSARMGLIDQVLQMKFNGATKDTDLADIVRAINSGLLLFTDAKHGFIIESLDEVNTLKDVSNNIKFHQIAHQFPSYPITVFGNESSNNYKIDPPTMLVRNISNADITYDNNTLKSSIDRTVALNLLDQNVIFRYLFNTIYEDGKRYLQHVTAEVTGLRLVSRWSSPGFKIDDRFVKYIQTGDDDSLEYQFKFEVTTTSSNSYVEDFSNKDDDYIYDATLDLFLVYIQAIINFRYSFLSTMKFIDRHSATMDPISFIYEDSDNVYKVTKVRSERKLHISFDCGYLTESDGFNVGDWYNKTLKEVCGSRSALYHFYTHKKDDIVDALIDAKIIEREVLFKKTQRIRPQVSNTVVNEYMFVMLYSGELTKVHDEIFYTVSSLYDRIHLDRYVIRQIDPNKIKKLSTVSLTLVNAVRHTFVDSTNVQQNVIDKFNATKNAHLLFYFLDTNILLYCRSPHNINAYFVAVNYMINLY
jgi:hypothetical protein